jgi:hypothetical protein
MPAGTSISGKEKFGAILDIFRGLSDDGTVTNSGGVVLNENLNNYIAMLGFGYTYNGKRVSIGLTAGSDTKPGDNTYYPVYTFAISKR